MAYPTASREMQEILKTNFEYFNRMVYDGMWNLLELFFAGTWWLFTGAILYKSKKKLIGILSILTGSFSLLDSCAGIFQLAQLHKMALNGYLILAIMWAVVLGAFLIKRPLPNIGQHEPDFSNNIPVIPAHDKA